MGFKSFLQHFGHDLKYGLDLVLPIAATAGSIGVSIFAPGLGPMYNGTVAAVILAEQRASLLKQQKAGPAKLANVLQLMEPVIAQGLADAGKANDSAAVTGYINAVVTILNTVPAPGGTSGAIQNP